MKKKVMGYDKGGKMPLPKKKPRYANPNHPMNAERTTGHPDGVTRKTKGGKVKKYDEGGKVEKHAKSALEMMKKYGKKAAESGLLGPQVRGMVEAPKTLKMLNDMLPEPKGPVSRREKAKKVKTVAAKSGGDMKTVPAGNKGLAKLPTEVRNRMGYAKKGGSVKAAKHGGPMCRGGGAATRGTKFKAT